MPTPSQYTIRRDAFDALRRRLQSSPHLPGVTVLHGGGHKLDRAEPVASQCPWVRLSAYGGEWEREAGSPVWTTPVMVKVETATRGTDEAEHFGLWGRIFAALMEWEADGYGDAPVTMLSIEVPAEGQDPDAQDPPAGLTYSGRGLLRLEVFTRWE